MDDILDCVVIGCGPAGLSSLVYLLMGQKRVIGFDKSAPGGKLNEIANIKNFPFENEISGPNLSSKIYSHVKSLNGVIKTEEITDISQENSYFKVSTNLNTYLTKYVIISIGTKTGNYGYLGESKFFGKGVSYCATCDGFFFRGKDVAVIGSSKEIVDASLYLSNLVNKVYVIPSKTDDDLNELYLKSNIEILNDTKLLEIQGSNKVESIKTSKGEIAVSGVFLFEESKPSNAFFQKLNIKQIDGYIEVDPSNMTACDKVYACGDCINKPIRQIINASSEGMNAALAIIKRLNTSK